MSSLVSSGNCKPGHDCRRVCSHRRHDATRQFRRVGVGGVYWALGMENLITTRTRTRRTTLVALGDPSPSPKIHANHTQFQLLIRRNLAHNS